MDVSGRLTPRFYGRRGTLCRLGRFQQACRATLMAVSDLPVLASRVHWPSRVHLDRRDTDSFHEPFLPHSATRNLILWFGHSHPGGDCRLAGHDHLDLSAADADYAAFLLSPYQGHSYKQKVLRASVHTTSELASNDWYRHCRCRIQQCTYTIEFTFGVLDSHIV